MTLNNLVHLLSFLSWLKRFDCLLLHATLFGLKITWKKKITAMGMTTFPNRFGLW